MKLKIVFIFFLVMAFLINPAYAKNNKNKKNLNKTLPYGLQKKVQRGGELPPGWKKKLAQGEVLDPEVYRQSKKATKKDFLNLPVDSKGIITITVGGKVLRLIENTREIIEILK